VLAGDHRQRGGQGGRDGRLGAREAVEQLGDRGAVGDVEAEHGRLREPSEAGAESDAYLHCWREPTAALDNAHATVGASRQATRRGTDMSTVVLEQYFEALLTRGDFARFFSDDIELSIAGTDQRAHGPAEAEQAIRYIHEIAFDARPDLRMQVMGADSAAIEADFVGRHIGEFAGVAATGRDVRVPYSVFYDLAGDKITGLRIYMPMDALVGQIRDPAPAAATA
jgi:predicted ester cyclase